MSTQAVLDEEAPAGSKARLPFAKAIKAELGHLKLRPNRYRRH